MVKISYNPDEEMMQISVDGGMVFYGNYLDFSRDPEKIAQFLKDLGVEEVYVDKDLMSLG